MAKINESDVTSSGRPVRPAGHPDLLWYRPGYVIEEGEVGQYQFAGKSSSATVDESLVVATEIQQPGEPIRIVADVPQLSDITIVSNTKYFDEVGKERAKIVLKVKNSSPKKDSVSGVDARIYQPRGA